MILDETDLEILIYLCNGLIDSSIGSRVGLDKDMVQKRIYKMQRFFTATTRSHLAAFAIANDLVRVSHLYDEEFREGIIIRNTNGEKYHLAEMRLEVMEAVIGDYEL